MKTLKRMARFSALIVMMAIATGMSGQTTSQRINEIKRAGKCLFAEATAATKAEAQSQACQLLSHYINSYIDDNGLSHPHVSATDIPGVNFMDMARGSNVRVFAFVNRDVITGDEPVAASKPTPAVDQTPTVAETPLAVDNDTRSIGVVNVPAETEVNSENYLDVYNKLPNEKKTQVRILVDLYSAKTLQSALKLLGRGNAEYIVKRFGPHSKCKNAMWTYWLVYSEDGETIEAFLAPGPDGQRYDLIKGTYDGDLNKYLGNNKMAVWFELR